MAKTVSSLELELDEVRERCLQAEQDGLELVQRYEAVMIAKDRELAQLRKTLASDEGGEACEHLRMEVMVWQLILFIALWSLKINHNPHLLPRGRVYMFLLCCWPLPAYGIGRLWRRFKRRYRWHGFRDNDLAHGVSAAWQDMRDRFRRAA